MRISGDLISTAHYHPDILCKIIIGQGTWCFLYDTKITIVTDCQEVPAGLTVQDDGNGSDLSTNRASSTTSEDDMVNQGRHKDVKHPEVWVAKHWALLHDKALCRSSSPSCLTHCTFLILHHMISTVFHR
jgi:hypothetical protein